MGRCHRPTVRQIAGERQRGEGEEGRSQHSGFEGQELGTRIALDNCPGRDVVKTGICGGSQNLIRCDEIHPGFLHDNFQR